MAQVRKDKIQIEVEINGKKQGLGKSLAELQTQYKNLNRELRQLEIGSESYNQKLEELRKVKGVLDEQRISLRGISEGLKAGTFSLKGFTAGIKVMGKELLLALGPIALIGQLIGALVAVTQETFAAATGLSQVNERINQLTGLQGEALLETSAKAQALANTYQVDVTDAINAANAAANAFATSGEDLGATYDRSLTLIGERLSALGPQGQEFLDQITEYSGQAEIAGLSAERFFNLVAEGINRGIPTDKLIDSVKEFDIRIKTLSTGQRDTLEKVLGKDFADQLVTNVEAGTITSIEALEQVSTEIQALGEGSADARKLVSDLFGGPGEDAAKFAEILLTTGDALEDVTGATSVYAQRKRELAALETEAQRALNELNFSLDGSSSAFAKAGLIIKTGFYTVLAQVGEFFNYFPGYMNVALQGLKAFVNIGISQIEMMLRFAFYPLVNIIEKITGTDLRLPRLEVDSTAYDELQARIEADRQQFAADEQRRLAAEEQRRKQQIQRDKQTQDTQVQQTQAYRSRIEQIERTSAEAVGTAAVDLTHDIEAQKFAIVEANQVAMGQMQLQNQRDVAEVQRLQLEAEMEVQRGLYQQFYAALVSVATVANERTLDNQLEQIESRYAREREIAGDNQEALAEIEARYEAEKLEAERKARNRRKLFEVAQVAINTAQSIVKTGAQLGYPAAIPFQIQAGIIGAIQAGVIASQKFAKGGMLPEAGRGGITKGPRHSQGGIAMFNNRTGAYVGEAEGNEVILSRATYAQNTELVNALLGASRYRNGRLFAEGGILSAGSTTPSAETIARAENFSDANIVRELQTLNQGLRNIDLRIGEPEAAAIDTLITRYRARKASTKL